jgi:Mn-containing catalase
MLNYTSQTVARPTPRKCGRVGQGTGHPETGEDLVVVDEAPEGVPPRDLPPQPAVFAPDYAPEEIAEIATKLRERAGMPKEPTGLVADLKIATKRATKKAMSRSK